MSLIAQRINWIKPSATIAVSTKAAQMKADGHNVISLGAGEPDFDTPEHIKHAAQKAMADGKTKYTPSNGIVPLREAIVAKFKRDNHLNYAMDEVTIGTGGKQILYNALMATIDHDDEVIIPAPYWVSYIDMTAVCGGVPVVVDCPLANKFRLTPQQLQDAITPKTKWLLLNSPSNPTGICYSEDELKALGDVLRRPENQHVHVMCDDMYEHLIYDDHQFVSFATCNPDLHQRTLTVNGVSKAYCMTGWRIGYAGGEKSLIAAMNKLTSQSTSSCCSIAQYAAVAALNGDHGFIAKHNEAFQARRNRVVDMLNAIDGIDCALPEGAFYVYPSCAGLIGRKTADGKILENDQMVVEYFLETQGVAVVHGEAFGSSPAFRISYATSMELLEDACQRIDRAVSELQ